MEVAGFNTGDLLEGVREGKKVFDQPTLDNPAYRYAISRQVAYQEGRHVEIFTAYDESLHYFMEWLKQLYGESEGKEGKGSYPLSVINTRDLHSLGQFFQEGTQKHFENNS